MVFLAGTAEKMSKANINSTTVIVQALIVRDFFSRFSATKGPKKWTDVLGLNIFFTVVEIEMIVRTLQSSLSN